MADEKLHTRSGNIALSGEGNKTVEPEDEGQKPSEKSLKEVGFEYVETLHNFKIEPKLKRREHIIEQALTLIDDVYVHLPLKRAGHAVDPIQRLKLLKYRNSKLDDRAFHKEMISIFTDLRDLHTNYILPSPYKDKVAFLPFLIEGFYEGKEKKYMVSKIFRSNMILDETFKEGVTITYWNGMPIERAIELNGDRNAGNNEYACHARGLERMTIRPLKMCLPPDEYWVDILYEANNKTYREKFKWNVAKIPSGNGSGSELSNDDKVQSALGIDLDTEIVRRAKISLFVRSKNNQDEEGNRALTIKNQSEKFPYVFTYATLEGKIGYIRIYTFDVNSADAFVKEFIEITKKFPGDGLIIDVRGNGGGLITAGEKLLQVLTDDKDKKIEPERFHFINTPLMLRLCKRNAWLNKWAPSIASSIETGAIYSQGFPLIPDNEPQPPKPEKYFKDIVLITDALCYSTTDIFAAGFKDNKIGKILGVDGNTGAGGANVWDYSYWYKLLHGTPPKEPDPNVKGRDWDFRVAIRRSTRVGDKIGMPLEDLGVKPDFPPYRMKENDLRNHNQDLIKKAVKILGKMRKERLKGEKS